MKHSRGAYEDAPRPDIILLDLNLPGMDGTELLDEINDSPDLGCVPVIMLTSSQDEADIVKSYAGNANAYLTNPVDPDEFIQVVRSLGEFWLKLVSWLLHPHSSDEDSVSKPPTAGTFLAPKD